MTIAFQMTAEPRTLLQETAETFLGAMASAATQVSVVTTEGVGGRFGVTVSAFASVSAEPPLVLVCINRKSPAIGAIETNGCFGVNLLGEAQSHIANCFAGRPGPHAPFDFDCAEWRTASTGAPLLETASAVFDCTLETAHDAGTHRIFIGRVAVAENGDHAPLAFSRRAYQALSPLSQE
ncbi:flavin reductase family protein [Rhodobacteraceae bacterium NNCM2]|nr:flavin reductase family protein [Coraliihabitans acroporae]